VKAAETVGVASRGYDAGKKINGRKRHIAVNTLGLLLCVIMAATSVQDRDGAKPLLELLAASFRRIRLIWADGGYAGKLLAWASERLHLSVQIVKRSDDTTGFVVLPRRWSSKSELRRWSPRAARRVGDPTQGRAGAPQGTHEVRLSLVNGGCKHLLRV
jgi:hypothetical protein